MEYVVYLFLGISILALIILFVFTLKISQLVNRLNNNLVLIPSLIENLKLTTEKIQDNLEITKTTINNLNNLITELKVLPPIIEEVGHSIKDLEAFLKGQVEVVKDDLHFTLEDLREILKDTKSISLEVKTRTMQVSQGMEPLVNELTESFHLGKQVLEHLNHMLKKTSIEINALSVGVSEVIRGLKKILKI